MTDENNQTALEFRDVTLEFGPKTGVFDMSMSIGKGEIVGLIGPSGSGKTTSIRILLGIYEPDDGEIYLFGENIKEQGSQIHQQIGYLPQQFVLYPDLTVKENLNFVSALYGVGFFERRKRIKELFDLFELGDAEKTLGRNLSGGMKRRLSLMASLLHRPKLLLLDEPTAGIDPVLRSKMWDYFKDYRDEGNSILVTTQYVSEATYCDYVAVMDQGQIIYTETPENLRIQAFGGEMISIKVDPAHTLDALKLVEGESGVKNARIMDKDRGIIHILVENGANMISEISSLFTNQEDIDLEQIDRYIPPFDEVFRLLIDRHRNGGP